MHDPAWGDWRQTLQDIEQSLMDQLRSLKAYEERFPIISQPAAPLALSYSEDWDQRLAEARHHAVEVDRYLADVEARWARWMDAFSAWRDRIQQHQGGTANGPSGSDFASGGAVESVRRPGEEAVRQS